MFLAESGQRDPEVAPVHAKDLDLLFLPEFLHDPVNQRGMQRQRTAQTMDVGLSFEQTAPQDQVGDKRLRDTQPGERRWGLQLMNQLVRFRHPLPSAAYRQA